MKRWAVLLMVLSLGTGWAFAQEKTDTSSPAVAAALAWLQLVDSDQYAESWATAAPYLKGSVSEEQWGAMLKGVRVPLGAVTSRVVKAAFPTTSIPGAPDGEYVVIHFDTSMVNKKTAMETVTVVKDQDGTWKVAGYLIA